MVVAVPIKIISYTQQSSSAMSLAGTSSNSHALNYHSSYLIFVHICILISILILIIPSISIHILFSIPQRSKTMLPTGISLQDVKRLSAPLHIHQPGEPEISEFAVGAKQSVYLTELLSDVT